MGPVLYRVRCRLRTRWRTTAALALVVAVFGGIVLTLAAGARRTLTASDRYAQARGAPYDASVEQQDGPPRTDEVAALPAVAEVRAATFVFGDVVPPGAEPSRTPEEFAGLVFAGSYEAFGAVLVDGRAPDPAQPGEFVATRSWLDGTGARLGSRFDLLVIPSGPASERGYDAGEEAYRLLTATLVGVVDGPSQLQDGYAVSLFPPSLLDAGDVGISATVSNVSLTSGSTLADLRAQLDTLPDGATFGIDPADWVPETVRDAIQVQGEGLVVLAAIAGIATFVVIGQLLSRQVRLSDAERLVLGGIGMTRRQVVADPLLLAAVPAVVGSAWAVPAAWLASDLFPTGFARQVEPQPGLRFEVAVLFTAALALVVLVLAWVLVVLAASDRARARSGRATVVDAVSRRAPVQAATAMRFAFVRQSRDSSGPRPAALGMMAVLALLVGALTFGASLDDLLERREQWGQTYEIGIGQGGGDSIPPGVVDVLRGDPNVEALALQGSVLTSVGTRGFDVAGIEPLLGSRPPHVFEGRLAAGDDEIAIGRVDARRLGVGTGDDLVLVGPAGPRTLRITGVAVISGILGGDGVGEGGLMTFEGLRLLDPEVAPTGVAIGLRPGVTLREAHDQILRETGLEAGPGDPPGVIVNLRRIDGLPYVVAAILGVLALLNLGHQLIVSVQRRRRDLAVLRALGADGRWVTGVVHWQASLFSALVMALGAPLGLIIGRVVYLAFVDRVGAAPTVSLPAGYLLVTVVALVILANGVATPNAQRARRQRPSRILAEE